MSVNGFDYTTSNTVWIASNVPTITQINDSRWYTIIGTGFMPYYDLTVLVDFITIQPIYINFIIIQFINDVKVYISLNYISTLFR